LVGKQPAPLMVACSLTRKAEPAHRDQAAPPQLPGRRSDHMSAASEGLVGLTGSSHEPCAATPLFCKVAKVLRMTRRESDRVLRRLHAASGVQAALRSVLCSLQLASAPTP